MLERALLNVILNAVEAMTEGGRLAVEARGAGHDPFVQIRIGDSGDGIDPETQDKVFDPFFTTKDHGTGLGLAIVHRVIEAHDGQITIESVPGAGTSVILSLPRHQGAGVSGTKVRRAGAA